MLVGCHLQPGAKQDVAKIVAGMSSIGTNGASGELVLTSAFLTEGKSASLFVHSPRGRLAVARLTESSPSTRLLMQLDLPSGQYALEADGGKIDVLGFLDTNDMYDPSQPSTKAISAGAAAQAKAQESKPAEAKAAAEKTPVAAIAEDKKQSAPKKEAPEGKKEVAKPVESKKEVAKPAETTKEDAKPVEAKKDDKAKQENKAAVADFVPAKKFAGAKPGMVFKKGAKGLGYYKDTYVKPPQLNIKDLKRKAESAAAGELGAKKRTLQGGLQYEVLKAAPPSALKATRGKTVQVRYDGRLASSGKRFDKGVIKFRLGAGEVIKGWDLGVDGMRVGEKRRLLIPAPLGYGARGAPPDIPRNAALCFEVELVKV